jgi:hypothetical protein
MYLKFSWAGLGIERGNYLANFLITLPLMTRVARWFIFKPNIPIWVNFGGPWNGKCWYIL